MNFLITGCAGLVGTEIAEQLIAQNHDVIGLDNYVLGTKRHLSYLQKSKNFHFLELDVSCENWHSKLSNKKFDVLIHLAANSDISLGHSNPEIDYNRTLKTTIESLNTARALKIPNFIFSSTSAVYGNNPKLPSLESQGELHPVSIYGAGKLASEAFISAYVENYGLNAWVYRFGNVVGQKLTHGVIFDFLLRLKKDPSKLTVLGNGLQKKTYIDVSDCVKGILLGFTKSPAGKSHHERFQIFNLSSDGATSVKEIAEWTAQTVGIKQTQIEYGQTSTGWVGDVPKTLLDTTKIKKLGWTASLESNQAVQNAIQAHYEWQK